MTQEEYDKINIGDIVRHKEDWRACVVIGKAGGCPIAIRKTILSSPREWDLIGQNELSRPLPSS